MGGLAGNGLVVVAGVVVAAETAPVVGHDRCHRGALAGQDLQPEQHCPEAVLLADVIGTRAEALLTAEGDAAGIEQVAEELPAGGGLETGDTQLLGYHVDGGAGGHRAGHPGQAAGIGRSQGCVSGEHRQAVAGVHEAVAPQDHVAVAVAVAGGAEAVGITLQQQGRQLIGVGEVGVGVAAAEVFRWGAVAHGAGRCAEQALEQPRGVGPRHGVHRVEGDREVVAQQIADLIEVEQLLHQGDVVVDPIDHLDLQRTDAEGAGRIQGQCHLFADAVAVQRLRGGVDGIGEGFGGRAAIGAIHLDAEVAIGAAGVMAGGEDDAGGGAVLADQVRGGRGGEDAAGGGDQPGHAMGGGHARDHADGAAVAVAAVAAHHQGSAGDARHGAQDRLDEALQVVRRLELATALAQAGGAGLLIGEGLIEGHVQHAAGHRGRPRGQ